MKINKRIALFVLIINTILVVFDIWHFFYFHETIFKNFKSHTNYLSSFYYYATLIFLGISENVVFIGLYWVLRVFKVRKWVKISAMLFLIGRIIVLLIATFFEIRFKLLDNYSLSMSFFGWIVSATNLLMAIMLFSFLFVRNHTIRRHFIGFAILMAMAYLVPRIESPLYDNFGYSWLLINQEFLVKLPFVISLVLFIDVFNLAVKRKLNDNTTAEDIPVNQPEE